MVTLSLSGAGVPVHMMMKGMLCSHSYSGRSRVLKRGSAILEMLSLLNLSLNFPEKRKGHGAP